VEPRRGRPRGQRQSMAEMTRLWYLIRVSKKYGLDTRKFLACFPHAWACEKSSYNGISIQLRQKTKYNCVFLVTQDQEVIMQIHLSQKLLKYLPEVDPTTFTFSEFTLASKTETLETSDAQIKDIETGVKWVNLIARVVGNQIRGTYSRGSAILSLCPSRLSLMAPGP